MLENTVKLREAVNERNTEMKELGALVKSLLKDTHEVIIESSSTLGSVFGMDEVEPPPRLKDIIHTAIPTNPANLTEIMHIIRRQVLYDTGMELDAIRRPLRGLEIVFDKLDLDQYLSTEGEESLRDKIGDPTFKTIFWAVYRKISDQAFAINEQRSFFCKVLEKANVDSQGRRVSIDQAVNDALRDPQIQQIKEASLEECIQSLLCKALKGREVHDVDFRTGLFRRVRGFLFPIMAKAAFDIFDRLEKCVEYARI